MNKPLPKNKKFIGKMLEDERGSISSKRVIGAICGLTLCLTMLANSVFSTGITPSDTLVNAVLTLACVCLASTSIDKFSAVVRSNPYHQNTPQKSVPPQGENENQQAEGIIENPE